jgi:hypothetical protein
LAFEKIASDEIRSGEVFMARDGDQRAAEPERHVLDEARFPAAGGSLEHDGHAGLRGCDKKAHLTVNIRVIRFLLDPILPDVDLAPELSHANGPWRIP